MVSSSVSVPVKLAELLALINKIREREELLQSHTLIEPSLISAYLTVDTLLKGKNAITNKAEFEFRDAVLLCLIIIIRHGTDIIASIQAQGKFAEYILNKEPSTNHSAIWDRVTLLLK